MAKVPRRTTARRWDLWIAVGLAIAVLAVYGQVRRFDFVNYDDPDYVTDNSHVRAGPTTAGIAWAFTSSYAANWIPLTWISHMGDVDLFGLDAGRHHLTNVLLHTCSTLLLFLVLLRLTGALWRSAFVAFLFGLHPLHVQSVAWIAERKDTLSTFFWMLALWGYARYVERPGPRRYAVVLVSFGLALLAKPMAVTLPFVLLLLDIWPLQRVTPVRRALGEKAPLLGLSAVVSVITFLVQRGGGAVMSLESIPLGSRLGNAFVSYLAYLGQIFWPAKLAAFYPYVAPSLWLAIVAATVIVGISVVVWRMRSRRYLAVGWFWFLGTLAPVIGLVQVGEQARADRYMYIPLIGIALMIAWGAEELMREWRRPLVAGIAGLVCCACAAAAWAEVGHWENSEILMRHALEVTTGNYVAHDNYGEVLRRKHRTAEAIAQFREAVRIRPQSVEAQNNLGEALIAENDAAEGMRHLQDALRLNPNFPEAHINIGRALDKAGKTAESLAEYARAVELRPDSALAHTGLGAVLAASGRSEEGLNHLHEAIRLRPEYADAHYGLAIALAGLRRIPEAAAEFAEAVRLAPDDAEAHYNLGTALGAQSRMEEAVAEFRTALRLKPGYANAELNLGKALALLENYDEARAHIKEALRLDPGLTDAREALEALKSPIR